MTVLNMEVNKSFTEKLNVPETKRAATLIQRTVRHWLKKFEERTDDEFAFEFPIIQVCDLWLTIY